MEKWYELKNKIDCYSKYTIKDFWDWWSDKKESWMEIRILKWEQAKQIGTGLKVYYSHTGVFVNTSDDLKRVIKYCNAHNFNIWFGVNPRKWNFTKWGKKGLSGGDHFVECVKFLFIDIDRTVKQGKATNKDLEGANSVGDLILEKLNENNWAKSYLKVCSGNGIQLLIKLDIPIMMPKVAFNLSKSTYELNLNFNKIKEQLRQGIGQQIITFINTKNRKDKYGVMIDSASFRIAQVGALHCTKNPKYDNNTWRGIVELKDEVNEGISDYILETEKEKKKIFGKGSIQGISRADKVSVKNIRQHKLVKLILKPNIPVGGANNYLIFSLKCLIKDNKIDINAKEIIELFHDINVNWKANITRNPVEEQFNFNPAVVRKWCVLNLYPPIYKKSETKDVICHGFELGKEEFRFIKNKKIISMYDIFILAGKDIEEDCDNIKKIMLKNVRRLFTNGILEYEDRGFLEGLFINFIIKCIEKYGLEETEYYYKYIIPEEVFFSSK